VKVLDGPWQDWTEATGRSSVTIGVLDGVHTGHRALLASLADSMTRTALTFDPHPVEVLRPGTPPRLITTIEERVELLDSAGVECVGVLDLAEIKEQSPREFVESVLVERLGVGQLVVGVDFRFGKDRSGDVQMLARLGREIGFEVETFDLITDDLLVISSSRIRDLIETGEVAIASTLLETWFTVTNTVIDGDKRGRDIGFPTANIRPPHRKVVPGTGVYSCFASVGGARHDAAVNVGYRPTFGGGELLIEAHILDFDDEIYGDDLTLEFVEYTRPELKFSGVEELVAQMEKDVARSRLVLEQARSRI
jgi:riboflavin kinase/FMN adenylyltransferase